LHQADLVDKYFEGKRNGFFIEAGAWDGVHLSNSLFFERERNWSGILIEPNFEAFRNLTKSGRRSPKSWAVNACLATERQSQEVLFDAADVFSSILGKGKI
jgi:hypothetical protein